ncbi:MAG: hypothetical protein SGPRY_010376, partial [Prymnesium sp.]
VLAQVKESQAEFEEVETSAHKVALDCEHFSMPTPNFAGLEDVSRWHVLDYLLTFLNSPFTLRHLVRADIDSYVSSCSLYEEYSSELTKLGQEDWISFRQRLWIFDDFVSAWLDKSSACPPGAVADYLRSELSRFRDPEHWRALYLKLKMEKMSIDKLCLHHFLACSAALVEGAEEFKALTARAVGEVAIREAIQEVSVWSQETSFKLTEHSVNGRSTPLIKEWKEMITSVSDLQSLLSSLKDSPFFAAFSDTVAQYEAKLSLLDSVLGQLNPIQRKWVYLEPIFGRGAMPHEQGRFKRVDEEFRSVMLSVGEDPRVFSLLRLPQLSETLAAVLDQLERCQKALADFLEEKRQRFPRFYFIGDEDLLEILGQARGEIRSGTGREERSVMASRVQAKNPMVIQSHLKKLFAGIHKVEFDEDNGSIVSMCSLDGEVVPLTRAVPVSESVESWLQLLSSMMKSTLATATNEMLASGKLDIVNVPSQPAWGRRESFLLTRLVWRVVEPLVARANSNGASSVQARWKFSVDSNDSSNVKIGWKITPFGFASLEDRILKLAMPGTALPRLRPWQVLCLGESVSFTRDAENAMARGKQGVSALKMELVKRLQDYTSYDTDDKLLQLKVKALLLDLIHNMDVCDQLVAAGTSSPAEWAWRKQLRQAAEGETVVMRMVASQFEYTYEYQGNAPKLVHTPLTDKCYLTLTQAMFMGYGGNPYGPAGTGKTESVKALGAAFGRQVLVFNCDEGIDSRSMCRIFIGLVKCGAWGCFDEFNRLLPDQLSEISQQIQIIQAAIKSRQSTVDLLGTSTQARKSQMLP